MESALQDLWNYSRAVQRRAIASKFKGQAESLAGGWKLLRSKTLTGLDPIIFEDPKPIGWNEKAGARDGRTLYLGC